MTLPPRFQVLKEFIEESKQDVGWELEYSVYEACVLLQAFELAYERLLRINEYGSSLEAIMRRSDVALLQRTIEQINQIGAKE